MGACHVLLGRPWNFDMEAVHEGKRNVYSVTADFTTHGGSHLYGLPCPSIDSLYPMDHFCTFDVSNIIPKTCLIFYTRLLNMFSRIDADLTLKPAYIGMCAKVQIVLEFSLTWI